MTELDEGTMPVEEFAKQKGLTPEEVIKKIRGGYYSGHLEEGKWFVNDHDRSAKAAGGNSEPTLPNIFYILGVLSFIVGVVFCMMVSPGDPGYMHPIAWLTLGTVQCSLFVAIGQGLSYLHQIAANTSKS